MNNVKSPAQCIVPVHRTTGFGDLTALPAILLKCFKSAALIFGLATAVLPGFGANTTDNFTGSATGSLLVTGNWSLSALPTVANDGVFPSGAATGIRTLTAGNLTVGSFDDLATSGTHSIRNETTTSTDSILTLGGSGNLGNGVSGTAVDLLYNAAGSTFQILADNPTAGGTGTLKLALGQNGNFNAAGTMVINSVITGSGFGFTKTGGGTLTLGGASTYSGATTVNQGTLAFSGAGNIGSSPLTIGSSGSGNVTALTVTRTAGGTTIDSSGLTYGGAVANGANAHNFTVTGTSANTIEKFGALTLNPGLMEVSIAPGTANSQVYFDSVTRNAGSILYAGRSSTAPGANNFSTATAGANIVFNSVPSLSGNGGSGTSVSILPWASVSTGPATYDSTYGLRAVNTGTEMAALVSGMGLGTGSAGQNASFDLATTISAVTTINSLFCRNTASTTLTFGAGAGGDTTTLNISSGLICGNVSKNIGAVANNGIVAFGASEGIVFVENSRTLAINSVVTGSGGLTVNLDDFNGTGANLVLAGNNTFSGVTRFMGNAGMTVRLTSSLALQNSTLDYNNYGASFSFGNGGTSGLTSYTFGGLKGSQSINLNNNNTTVQAVALTIGSAGDSDSTTYSGILSSSTSGGSIIKDGAGTLTLTGANTYDGGTTIKGGVLNAGIAQNGSTSGPLGKSGNIVFGGGTLQFSSASASWDPSSLIAAGTSSSTVAIDPNGQNLTFGTALTSSQSGGLTINDTAVTKGYLKLSSAAQHYTGATTITAGKLVLQSGTTLDSASISVASGATYDVSAVSGYTLGAKSLTGSGSVHGAVATGSSSAQLLYPASAGGAARTLAFDDNMDMSAGGAAYFGLDTTYNSSANDKITVTGTLTLNSSDTIHVVGMGAALDSSGNDYVLLQAGTLTMATTPSLVFDGTQPSNYRNYTLVKSGNNLQLHYNSTINPIVLATVTPTSAVRNQSVTVNATYSTGSGTFSSMTVDLSSIGGSATQTMTDSGDHVHYSYTATVAASASAGAKNLTVTVNETGGGTGSSSPQLTVTVSTETWNGSAGDNNWSSGANWASTYAPGISGDSLVFAGTTRLSPSMDNSYTVNGLVFDSSAGSFNISSGNGSSLTLSGGLMNNSGNAQTVNVPVALSGAETITAASGNILVGQTVATAGNSLTVAGANSTTISGAISGGGNLIKNDAGTLDLGGANDTVGAVTMAGGTIQNGALSATGYGIQAGTVSAVLNGTGSALTKATSGTGILSGNNGYTGGTTISAGTLQLANAGALGTGAVTIGGSGTLDLNGLTIGNGITTISSGGIITNSSASAAVLSTALGVSGASQLGNFTVGASGNISVNDVYGYQFGTTLTKTGPGTLTLGGTGVNSYSGGNPIQLVVNNGTVVLAKTGGVAADGVSVNSGALLQMDPAHTVTTGWQPWAGQLNSGISLNGGTLDLNGVTGLNNLMRNLSGSGVVTNSSTSPAELQITTRDHSMITFSGAIADGPGTGKVSVSLVNAGTTDSGRINVFSGNNTYSGDTTISFATLELGSATAAQNSTINVNASAGLGANPNLLEFASGIGAFTIGGLKGNQNFSVADTNGTAITLSIGNNGADTTYSGVMNGGGAINKIGAGTLTLSGINTYTGSTAVNAGTLRGTGTINGAVTVNAGGTLAMGTANALGSLTINNTLALSGTNSFRLNKTGATLTSDKILGTTSITAGGTLNVSTNGGDALASGDSFALFNAGMNSGWFSSVRVPVLASGISWDTNHVATAGVLDVYTFTTTTLSVSTLMNTAATVSAAKLTSHASSARGTPVAGSASTPSHGTASVSAGALTYTPTTGYSGSDSFTVTFVDGHGIQTMTVNVTVGTQNVGPQLTTVNAGGYGSFTASGLPSTMYTVQISTNLSDAPPFNDYLSVTSAPNGVINFLDTTSVADHGGQAYYRLKQYVAP